MYYLFVLSRNQIARASKLGSRMRAKIFKRAQSVCDITSRLPVYWPAWMQLHFVTNMITGNKPPRRRFGYTQFDQELMSAGTPPYSRVCITRTCIYMHIYPEIHTRTSHAHVVIRYADLFYSVHITRQYPRDLETTARPSINLFNPIICILCVRHRSHRWRRSRATVTLRDDRHRKLCRRRYTRDQTVKSTFPIMSKLSWQQRYYKLSETRERIQSDLQSEWRVAQRVDSKSMWFVRSA